MLTSLILLGLISQANGSSAPALEITSGIGVDAASGHQYMVVNVRGMSSVRQFSDRFTARNKSKIAPPILFVNAYDVAPPRHEPVAIYTYKLADLEREVKTPSGNEKRVRVMYKSSDGEMAQLGIMVDEKNWPAGAPNRAYTLGVRFNTIYLVSDRVRASKEAVETAPYSAPSANPYPKITQTITPYAPATHKRTPVRRKGR